MLSARNARSVAGHRNRHVDNSETSSSWFATTMAHLLSPIEAPCGRARTCPRRPVGMKANRGDIVVSLWAASFRSECLSEHARIRVRPVSILASPPVRHKASSESGEGASVKFVIQRGHH